MPWQKIGTDLFEFKQKPYLLIVQDSIFARHIIPEVVISDNGPQFSSEAYKRFAEDYQFKYVTSSPYTIQEATGKRNVQWGQ